MWSLTLAVLVPITLTHRAEVQQSGCMIKVGEHTEEGTPSFPACLCDPSNNSCSCTEVKFSTGKVIEEEEGLCSLGQDVIHTHCNQVLTNGVMFVALLGNLHNRTAT